MSGMTHTYPRLVAAIAVLFLLPHIAAATPIVSCRGQTGTVEFLDAKGRTVNFFTNKEDRKEKAGAVHYDLVNVYGCLKGKYAYVVHQWGTCPGDEGDCVEKNSSLEILDHTGRRIWKESISLNHAADVAVARNDERFLFTPAQPPFGVMVIEPNGDKKLISFEGKGVALRNTEISPNGRYGIARAGSNLLFFDAFSGKTHPYNGPGQPWVNDGGKFEVWAGSIRKEDWSRGPDGKKVYEFKFDD